MRDAIDREGTAAAIRALVVDDEPTIRRIVARWLREAGCDCHEAASGAEAWEYLQTHEVHLATLDITMPGLSGTALLGQIKEEYPDTEVLMLTAQQDTALAIESLTCGAHAYLIKPVQAEELLLHATKALERRELRIGRRKYTQMLEQQLREQTATIRQAHEETIIRLMSASRYRDEETGAHIRRTGLYSALLAEVLGWPADAVADIRMAAPMHDLGKIGIPDAVLRKPGPLAPDEFEVMKAHASIGAHMLDGSGSRVLRMAHEIALCHHERWDGRGYPRGLSGEQIPETARIVALVDVYDALTHDRVYRKAMPEEQALAIMEAGRGSHFDPTLFGVFLALVPQMRQIALANPDEQMPDFSPRSAQTQEWIDWVRSQSDAVAVTP